MATKSSHLFFLFIISITFLLSSSVVFGLGIAPGERIVFIGKDMQIGEEKTYAVYIINNEKKDFFVELRVDSELVKLSNSSISFKSSEDSRKIFYNITLLDNSSEIINITASEKIGNFEAVVVSKINIVNNSAEIKYTEYNNTEIIENIQNKSNYKNSSKTISYDNVADNISSYIENPNNTDNKNISNSSYEKSNSTKSSSITIFLLFLVVITFLALIFVLIKFK